MKEETCLVVESTHLRKKYYLLKIESEYISTHSKPGNFLMVTVSSSHDPLLKRPFGILDSEPPYIWIYYEVVGRGTELLSRLQKNDRITILGPLGNSFHKSEKKKILLIAGGRGIAPLYFTIKHYTPTNDVYLIYGAKSKNDLNLLEKLKSYPLKKMFLYSDDGSIGKQGDITTDIKKILIEFKIDTTISCGPDAMFQNLSQVLKNFSTDNYVSLESLMGCGFGICYSCAVKTRTNGYKKVCQDGPIFKLEDIEW